MEIPTKLSIERFMPQFRRIQEPNCSFCIQYRRLKCAYMYIYICMQAVADDDKYWFSFVAETPLDCYWSLHSVDIHVEFAFTCQSDAFSRKQFRAYCTGCWVCF